MCRGCETPPRPEGPPYCIAGVHSFRFGKRLVHYRAIQTSATKTVTSQAQEVGSARRWSIVLLLCLGMVIAYVDRTALSVAITRPDFRAYFHLTDSQRGLMNSAFFWSYALL